LHREHASGAPELAASATAFPSAGTIAPSGVVASVRASEDRGVTDPEQAVTQTRRKLNPIRQSKRKPAATRLSNVLISPPARREGPPRTQDREGYGKPTLYISMRISRKPRRAAFWG
jgi:hypothetical protein